MLRKRDFLLKQIPSTTEEAMKREWDAWLEEYKQISSADHIPLELSNKLKSLLLQCVQKGYADVLKEAYEKIPLARRATIDDLRRTALHLAVDYCKTVAVVPMLESVDPEDLLIQDENGQTALHFAILKRKPELSIRMLKISPGLANIQNRYGDTPLILAARNKLEDVCIHMIKHSCVEKSLMFVQNLDKDTVFHLAVDNGLQDLCSLLIKCASADNLLLQDNDGDTVLHVAIKNKMPELCILMLEISPRLGNIQNRYADTPLILATYCGLEDVCIHMIKRSCVERSFIFVQNLSKDTAFHHAVWNGWKNLCNLFIEHASEDDLLLQDNGGKTVLHVAIQNNMPELCIRMLEISPRLGNIKNSYGNTPFIFAAVFGLDNLCIHMIERSRVERSFIFEQNSFKNTAFHLAASKGMKKLCSLLIKRASADDLLLQDNHGDTVLHVAIQNNMPKLCRRMIQISPRLGHIQNRNGNTTLHLALYNGNFEMAHQMLQVNPYLGEEINGEGKTPLDILAEKASSVISSRAQLGVIDSLIYPWLKSTSTRQPKDEENLPSSSTRQPRDEENLSSTSRQPRDEENPPSTSTRQPRDEENSLITSTIDNAFDNDEGVQKQASWLHKMFYKFLALTLVERVKKIRDKKQQYLLICDLVYKLAPHENCPVVIVAELGLTEVVKKIMNEKPEAIHQRRPSDNKNAVLVAVENRRADVYELLLHHCRKEDIFGHKDDEGNNALHLVAKFNHNRRPWRMPGNTMQMHWEIKWYKYVKDSIPKHLRMATNKEGLTPAELFTKEHRDLYKSDGKGEWVSMTSQAFSVVAGLIATVAFNSATTIPGSNSERGYPNFRGRPALSTFVISSFIALFFSLISLIRFLSILISPLDDLNESLNYDNCRSLPKELIKGLTTLFLSIVAMLVSFCAGHYFYLIGTTLFLFFIPVYLIGCLIIASFFVKKVYSGFLFYAVRRKPEPWYEISK